jgi:hypothetical protein
MPKSNEKGGSTTHDVDLATLRKDTDAIKRLLMLFLVKLGATSEEISAVLDVDPSIIRRMVPSRRVKKFVLPSTSETE